MGRRTITGIRHFYMPYVEYIKIGKVQSNKLRRKLLREGLKEAKCECCGNEQWNGVPIPL